MILRNFSPRSSRIAAYAPGLPNASLYRKTSQNSTRPPHGPDAKPGRYWRLFYLRTFIWIMEHRRAINNMLGPLFSRRIVHLSGRSMYPTLTGDCELALVDTHYKGGVGIRVGDVVRFWHPHGLDQALAKRVKGLEGHTYTKNLQGLGIERVVVRKGYCKVVGDNENNSGDSREFGSVPLANIEGKLTRRWGQEGSWKIRNNDTMQKSELGRLSALSEAVVRQARRLALGILPATRTQALVPRTPRNAPVISSTKSTRLIPSALNKTHIISSTRSKGLVPNMLRKAKVVSSTQPGALSPRAPKKPSVVSSAKSKADT